MITIDKNMPPTSNEVESFLKAIDFSLPIGLLEFFKEANGADVSSETKYIVLWPLTDLIPLNELYNVNEYAPDFFIFGSDGSDTAYAVKKGTSHIFEMPFIGMSNEESTFICESFDSFIKNVLS